MTIGTVNAASYYDEIGLGSSTSTQKTGNGDLGLEDFMNLLVTELTHQDPFKPMENSEMATQVSQFATVNGISELNKSFSDLSSALTSDQALQAANLVGRTVLVDTPYGQLSNDEPLQGSIDLPASAGNVRIRITNGSGELVRELQLGSHEAGQLDFSWDGYDDSGDFASEGVYQVSAIANFDDVDVALPVYTSAEVESVTLGGSGGVQLNLGALGQVSMNDVVEIQ
jgi:flagellar basal-body rod modification protein FlgD